jgi:hypothetical protein
VSGNLQLLAGTLARAKHENRAALITGMTAGFPTVNEGIAAIQAMLNSGADVVEVGLPHSDPVLDGPVVQAADQIALRGGVRIADVIRTVREAYQATGKPVLVMSYWNPIDKYGAGRFSSELAEAGGAGCILPDLPVQESARWRESAARHNLATIFVAAPSSTDERLRLIADGSHRRPGGCRCSRQLAGAAYQGDHRTPRLRRNRDFQRCAGGPGGRLRRRRDRRVRAGQGYPRRTRCCRRSRDPGGAYRRTQPCHPSAPGLTVG